MIKTQRKITGYQDTIDAGQQLVKMLGLLPPNKLTPKLFIQEAVKIAKEYNIKSTIITEGSMRGLKMGGILAVSQGSNQEAQGVILDYHPKNAKKTIALTGKSITFDSGGISLKTPKNLHEMKYDMLGGATALAVLQISAKIKLPHRIIIALFAAENLPSGTAMRPGDVITMYNKKTVEVINTDAEGRLMLADSLHYLQSKYKPEILIDIATLSQTSVILGDKITAAFGTSANYNKQLQEASKKASEPVHFLPLFDEYTSELQSPVANLANISTKHRFDTVLAALFLKEFINPPIPWIHIDIGGTAYNANGPTGVMVKTMVNFLENIR